MSLHRLARLESPNDIWRSIRELFERAILGELMSRRRLLDQLADHSDLKTRYILIIERRIVRFLNTVVEIGLQVRDHVLRAEIGDLHPVQGVRQRDLADLGVVGVGPGREGSGQCRCRGPAAGVGRDGADEEVNLERFRERSAVVLDIHKVLVVRVCVEGAEAALGRVGTVEVVHGGLHVRG